MVRRPARFARLILFAVVGVIAAAGAAPPAGASGAGQAAPARDPRTILDRVFSVAQAERGEKRFAQSCGSCHRTDEFVEPAFSARWEGQTLGDLFGYLSTAMPGDDPGSLKPAEYAEVIAFFLGQNGYPVGRDDLAADPAVLATIGIVPNPK